MKLPFGFEFKKSQPLPLPQGQAWRFSLEQYQFNLNKSFAQLVSEGFYMNAAVQGCVSAYTKTLNEPPLTVLKGDKVIDKHPLGELFKRPNPDMAGATLLAFVSAYIGIGGNCYLVKTRNSRGATIAIHPYHDGQMTPIRGEYEWIAYYMYEVDGIKRRVDKHDVIQLRSHLIDPNNPHKGMSPILAAARGTDTYNELARQIYNVLKNDLTSNTVLVAPEGVTLNDPQIKSMREQIRDRNKSGEQGMVSMFQGGIKAERLGMNFKELQAVETFSQAEVAICQAFGVHPIVAMTYAGLQHSTYSNYQEAMKTFTTLTRVPIWNLWEEQIALGFQDDFPDITCNFDTRKVEALQPSPMDKHTSVVSQFQSNIITQNEARAALGRDPLKTGDALLIHLAPPMPFGAKSYTYKDAGGEEVEASEYYYKGEVLTDTKADEYEQKVNRLIDRHADNIASDWADVCAELQKEVTGNVKGEPFNLEKWKKKFLEGTHESRLKLIREMIKEALEDVDFNIQDMGNDVDAVLKLSTLESSAKIAESIGTIRDEVRELLAKHADLSGDELRAVLSEKFKTLKVSRAAAIGRTTSTAVTGQTQNSVWQKMNERLPKQKQIVRIWLTRQDGHVRGSHLGVNRQPESDEGTWTIGGAKARYPADSTLSAADAVNCRCVTIPTRKGRL